MNLSGIIIVDGTVVPAARLKRTLMTSLTSVIAFILWTDTLLIYIACSPLVKLVNVKISEIVLVVTTRNITIRAI